MKNFISWEPRLLKLLLFYHILVKNFNMFKVKTCYILSNITIWLKTWMLISMNSLNSRNIVRYFLKLIKSWDSRLESSTRKSWNKTLTGETLRLLNCRNKSKCFKFSIKGLQILSSRQTIFRLEIWAIDIPLFQKNNHINH